MKYKLAVLGNPIQHSRSPQLHRAFAEQAGLVVDYQKIEVPLDGFEQAAWDFIKAGGTGFNITLPFKLEAFAFANNHSARALAAKAVNTIQVNANENYGDNTDGLGFVRDMTINQGFALQDKTVLIHGAGGAVRGLLPALLAEHPKQVHIINRSTEKVHALVEEFPSISQALPTSAVDLLIDASSFDCVSYELLATTTFSANAFAYDLKYADQPTPFLKWAKMRGLQQGCDGFGMLVEQAAASFALWTGFLPNTPLLLKGSTFFEK